jgi:hypothetical protein
VADRQRDEELRLAGEPPPDIGDGRAARPLLVEEMLTRALTPEPVAPMEPGLRISAARLVEQVEQAEARGDIEAAMRLLGDEIDRITRWVRAVEHGTASAGGDQQADDVRAHLADILIRRATRALALGAPLGLVSSDVVRAVALGTGAPERLGVAAFLLAGAYQRGGHPELALPVLIRAPAFDPALHMVEVLRVGGGLARTGQARRVAQLLEHAAWAGDASGLERRVLRTLVVEEPPTPEELSARSGIVAEELNKGVTEALKAAVFSIVAWAWQHEPSWRVLGAVLALEGPEEQAAVAYGVSGHLAREAERRG